MLNLKRDGTSIANGVLHVFDNFARQPDAILEAAAILIRALVNPRKQELIRPEIHARIDIYNVEAS